MTCSCSKLAFWCITQLCVLVGMKQFLTSRTLSNCEYNLLDFGNRRLFAKDAVK
jgi:hypothetical protein